MRKLCNRNDRDINVSINIMFEGIKIKKKNNKQKSMIATIGM